MSVSIQYPAETYDVLSPGVREALYRRILETVALMDRRGYGVPLELFAELLYGGRAPPEVVASVLADVPGVRTVGGLVVRADRTESADAMAKRQAAHGAHVQLAERVAADFGGRLVSSCPLARAVTLTGSACSGGFDPRDDVDVNIVARDGSKYTVYLWSLALSALTSLRNRGKATDEMSALPFLPKIVCINVVWEESQIRPFVRKDKWLAYELLMHQPVLGADYLRAMLEANPWLRDHFPQFFDPGFLRPDPKPALDSAGEPRAGRRFFSFVADHPRLLAVIERASRFAVMGIHRVVSLTRARKLEAREREAFVNLVKRPYSVYDVPGRERPVPAAAFEGR